MRWFILLQDYDFVVKYIPGDSNAADFSSRFSVLSVENSPRKLLHDEDRKIILNEYHEISGHGGEQTMNFLLRKRFNWPGLTKEINEMVRGCKVCSKGGRELHQTKHKPIVFTHPNEIWEADLIGPIYVDLTDKRYILVIIDHYTKWIETSALRDKSADTVVKNLNRIAVSKNGTPKRILTDNGTEFSNAKMRQLRIDLNFERLFASPQHHETGGAVERVNKTLMNKIRKLSHFGQKDWSSVLQKATFAVNISYNRR